VEIAYESGVPMDVTLPAAGTPISLPWAVRDARSRWRQGIQVVEGWFESSEVQEAVFDIACSDGQQPDVKSLRSPGSGARVNLF